MINIETVSKDNKQIDFWLETHGSVSTFLKKSNFREKGLSQKGQEIVLFASNTLFSESLHPFSKFPHRVGGV